MAKKVNDAQPVEVVNTVTVEEKKTKAIPLFVLTPITFALSLIAPILIIILFAIWFAPALLGVLIFLLWLMVVVVSIVPPLFLLWFSADFKATFAVGGTMLGHVEELFGLLNLNSPLTIVVIVLASMALILGITSYILTWIFLLIGKAKNKKHPFFTVFMVFQIVITVLALLLVLAVIILIVVLAIVAKVQG